MRAPLRSARDRPPRAPSPRPPRRLAGRPAAPRAGGAPGVRGRRRRAAPPRRHGRRPAPREPAPGASSAAPAELEALTRDALRSYLRYWCESFRLPGWPLDDLVERTRTVGEHHVRDAHRAGHGVVVPLPHMANWDWAGAWACATGMPLWTVAERLRPERLYDEFVAHRRTLGMEVLPLTGGDAALPRLEAWVRRGGLVCLLADRDLSRTGVEVQLCGTPARLPRGPAVLARRTGAPLVPVTLHYAGADMVVTFHPPVPHAEGDDGVVAMMQGVADAFTSALREHPQDWHMMQRVFADGPGAAVRVGLVCPYSLDVPGGVQTHVRDLAEALIGLGHDVSVLAPSESDDLPSYVVPAGRAVPVPYNGSVARVSFGPVGRGGCGGGCRTAPSTCCTCTSRPPRACRCSRCWAPRAGRRDVPHRTSAPGRCPRPRRSCDRRWRRSAPGSRSREHALAHPGRATSAVTPVLIPNGVVRRPVRGRAAAGGVAWAGPARWASWAASTSRARASRCCSRRSGGRRGHPGLRLLVAGPGDVDDGPRAGRPAGARPGDLPRPGRRADKGAAAAPGGRLRRAEHRWGELRHRARRGDGGRRHGRRQRPDAFRRVLADGACGELFPVGDAAALASPWPGCWKPRTAGGPRGGGRAVAALRLAVVAGGSPVYETVAGNGS